MEMYITKGISNGVNHKGFTVMEMLLALAIFGLLLVISIVGLGNLRDDSDLRNDADAVRSVLRSAQNKTIASQSDAQYGVYFNTAATPHEYILFQGTDYASGTPEQTYALADSIEFNAPSFTGLSGQEVVFNRIQGASDNPGNVQLRVKAVPAKLRTVYVESSGNVEINTSVVPSDADREKDTRHVHIDYTRQIDTTVAAGEEILLDFDSGAHIEHVVIADNLSGGQIVWEDTIDVAGENQTVKLHTHQLNAGPGLNETQFSIHRDRRPNFNTKALTITLPGTIANPDGGTLLEYDAAGTITPGTSIHYVPPPQPQ